MKKIKIHTKTEQNRTPELHRNGNNNNKNQKKSEAACKKK